MTYTALEKPLMLRRLEYDIPVYSNYTGPKF